MYKKTLIGILSVLLISNSLTASELLEQKHIDVGSRSLPTAEKVSIREKIAEEENFQKPSATMKSSKEPNIASTHEGAYHNPSVVSFFGDTVELEDGSVWQVSSSDKSRVLNWWTSDLIVIHQNKSWFSSYEYELMNVTQNITVKVNLLLGPYYNGSHTYWIKAIDYWTGTLYLNDGSIWQLGGSILGYQNIYEYWLPNDTLIIGINNDAIPTTPNILINVNTNDWVKARCIY